MFCQTEGTSFGMKIDFGITSVPLSGRNSTFPNQNATGTISGGFLNSSTSNSGFGQPSQSHTQFGGFGNTNTVPFVNQQTMNPFGTNALTQALGQNNNQTGFGFNPNGQPSSQDLNNPFLRTNISAPIALNSSAGSTDVSGTVVKFNPVAGTDTIQNRGLTQTIRVLYWCINFMKEYEEKSLEELRFEDYKQGRKGPQTQTTGFTNTSASTGGLFPSASTNFFNQPFTFPNSSNTNNQFVTPSTSLFPPKTSTNSIFNNPQTSGFSQSNPSTGFFNLKPNSFWPSPSSGFNQLNPKPAFSTANTQATQNFLYKPPGFSLTPSATAVNNNPFSNLQKNTYTFAPSLNYRPFNFPNSNPPPLPQIFKTQFPFNSSTMKQNSSTTNPIHDQILGLMTTPFGRCSLLKNLQTSSNKTDHVRNFKSAFTVNKPRNRTQYKIATNTSLKIKPKVIGVGVPQKALFDSLEQEDSYLLETFQVHPSAKRLVFRSKPSDTFQTVGSDNSDANISATSSCGESSTTDKENLEL
ncbi:nuclear pore complex protein Nup98-Nup96-like [Leptopilina heterotoma]|uniref:nuclear pore complex protein Nup98-Nup96-like n=1 Tax=Leptopilina heterotoma TaxID=63436 RepID=UPI001CA9E436|nr:nuclear pore complex protein Nup98-Nup96-like [Leptopilina heterotoma]